MREAIKRPNDLSELKGMIASRTITLPEQQEQVARMALAKPEVIAFGTVGSIAAKCSVSASTVVRAATGLGFTDFRDFRGFFRLHLRKATGLKAD
ncbi:MurR/RpiR family transcriptional regulator [Mesorhizobium sp. ORS 3428]|uniref:MurR/RpiR family transcriptional regulator n=1 Tax=Mesorhizobium sp. ORS 3428 TaxID=540997 RepID=UPI0008DA5AC9|nr:MurR/RpiR family transcriptional regulator [Mesorhizobium sp. ORS 3428]OHV87640.1 transcriptional regulator [Mesorhizobium sp. ORS 3428]